MTPIPATNPDAFVTEAGGRRGIISGEAAVAAGVRELTMSSQAQRVVVLGASDDPERYSNMAVNRLLENGHDVVPVHPTLERIGDLTVVSSLDEVEPPVDTLTVYVSPSVSSSLRDAIVGMAPGRVIFNPGAENPELESALADEGIPTLRACTLVLLSTGQF